MMNLYIPSCKWTINTSVKEKKNSSAKTFLKHFSIVKQIRYKLSSFFIRVYFQQPSAKCIFSYKYNE